MDFKRIGIFLFVAICISFHTEKYTYTATVSKIPVVKATIPEVEVAARIAWAEASGEGLDRQLWVVQALVNRASDSGKKLRDEVKNGFCGYKVERYNHLDTILYQHSKNIVSGKIKLHNFRYFLNPQTATNIKLLRRSRLGVKNGNHTFY